MISQCFWRSSCLDVLFAGNWGNENDKTRIICKQDSCCHMYHTCWNTSYTLADLDQRREEDWLLDTSTTREFLTVSMLQRYSETVFIHTIVAVTEVLIATIFIREESSFWIIVRTGESFTLWLIWICGLRQANCEIKK